MSTWRVSETPCGLIAAFARENDAEKLLQRGDLARVFGRPVQVQIFFILLYSNARYRETESLTKRCIYDLFGQRDILFSIELCL